MMASCVIVLSRVEMVCASWMRGASAMSVGPPGVATPVRREEGRSFFLIPVQHVFEILVRVPLDASGNGFRHEIFRQQLLGEAPFERVQPLNRKVEIVG